MIQRNTMNYAEGITYKNKYSTLYRIEMISETDLSKLPIL